MARELGIVIPETEEEFARYWKALGRCFWQTYIGLDPESPYDLRRASYKHKIVAKLERMP